VLLVAGNNDGRGFLFEIVGSEIVRIVNPVHPNFSSSVHFLSISQKPMVTLEGHSDVIREVVPTIDGKLLTCGEDGKLFQWDPLTPAHMQQQHSPPPVAGAPSAPRSPDSHSSSSSSGKKIPRPKNSQRDSPY